jgi:hypothetical protein
MSASVSIRGMVVRQHVCSIKGYSETLEGHAMAQREQHGNREAKKPKKDKPKEGVAQPRKWAVSEMLEEKDSSKH